MIGRRERNRRRRRRHYQSHRQCEMEREVRGERRMSWVDLGSSADEGRLLLLPAVAVMTTTTTPPERRNEIGESMAMDEHSQRRRRHAQKILPLKM